MSAAAARSVPLAGARAAVRRAVLEDGRRPMLWAAILGAHVFAAPFLSTVRGLSTLHAFGTVAVGLVVALVSRSPATAGYMAAYVIGSEVLWRMTSSGFFWEGGKYATAAMLLVAMVRHGMRPRLLALLYFVLLLPSISQLFPMDDPWAVRGMLSANLSGPLALMVCAWYFSNLKLGSAQLQRLLLMPIGPTLAIATIAALGIVALEPKWGTESNEAASGGYGPNQVSSALGLGALFGIFFLVKTSPGIPMMVLVGVATLFLAAQSALTFSRGGLYNCALAILCASVFWVRGTKTRRRLLITGAIFAALVVGLVLPRLDAFTGGALVNRFADYDTTKRVDLAMIDVQIWAAHPLFGVGPGQSKEEHAKYLDRKHSTHTEFSRLVAEHGAFGFGALMMLGVLGLSSLMRARTPKGKAFSVAMSAWSCAYMANAAMRLAAPSFALGLGFVTLLPDEDEAAKPRRGAAPAARPNGKGAPRPPAQGALRVKRAVADAGPRRRRQPAVRTASPRRAAAPPEGRRRER